VANRRVVWSYRRTAASMVRIGRCVKANSDQLAHFLHSRTGVSGRVSDKARRGDFALVDAVFGVATSARRAPMPRRSRQGAIVAKKTDRLSHVDLPASWRWRIDGDLHLRGTPETEGRRGQSIQGGAGGVAIWPSSWRNISARCVITTARRSKAMITALRAVPTDHPITSGGFTKAVSDATRSSIPSERIRAAIVCGCWKTRARPGGLLLGTRRQSRIEAIVVALRPAAGS